MRAGYYKYMGSTGVCLSSTYKNVTSTLISRHKKMVKRYMKYLAFKTYIL